MLHTHTQARTPVRTLEFLFFIVVFSLRILALTLAQRVERDRKMGVGIGAERGHAAS